MIIGRTPRNVPAKEAPIIKPTAKRIITARNASAKSYRRQHLVVHLYELLSDSL